jgi:MFS transporter, Spinster family, sphingosine-1-phosphate transporter
MFMNIVPCYTIIASVAMPNMRGVACAVALAAIHLLGDIWSASLMGWMIDTFGQADSMATIFGRALTAIGAVPVSLPGRDPENLTAGMLVVIPALMISGGVLLSGSRHLPREMALLLAKLRAIPSRLRPVAPGTRTRA